MSNQVSRIDQISDKDKLWELFLHTLAGWHGNVGANRNKPEVIARKALHDACIALKIWKEMDDCEL